MSTHLTLLPGYCAYQHYYDRAPARSRRRVVRNERDDAQANSPGNGCFRQGGQDCDSPCRTPDTASAVQKDYPPVEEVRGARSGQQVQDGRTGPDSRM
jgi:hypothetical protein